MTIGLPADGNFLPAVVAARPTAAQMRERIDCQRRRDEAAEVLVDAAREMTFAEMLDAMRAIILARPDRDDLALRRHATELDRAVWAAMEPR